MRQRKRSQAIDEQDQSLLPRIYEIKADHPSWGYKRVWAYLRYRDEITIGKNRVYRIMRENNLLTKDTKRLRAKRTGHRPKPRTERPNEIWGIDMTKILVQSYGWVYLVVVKDWGSKKIVGWDLACQSKTSDWLNALSNAVNTQFPNGIREKENTLKLVSDNGSQPTSCSFMQACYAMQIKQIFTSYNNPKGNADTERVMRTIKEDLVWPNEWYSFQQLYKNLEKWIDDYNQDFPHSAIEYLTPQQYEDQFKHKNKQKPSLALA